MYRYEFRFLNGIAEVYELETGNVILHQPFKPMDASHGSIPQPWGSRDEAYAWTEANFNHHLQDEIPDNEASVAPAEVHRSGTQFNPDGSVNLVRSRRIWDLESRGIDSGKLTTDELWSGILTPEELAEQKRLEEEARTALNTSVETGN
jgi:hypothetical protein